MIVALVLAAAPIACGTQPTTAPGDGSEIPFTIEERRLLEGPDTVTHPAGPVSRENYRQQLDALEQEIAEESAR